MKTIQEAHRDEHNDACIEEMIENVRKALKDPAGYSLEAIAQSVARSIADGFYASALEKGGEHALATMFEMQSMLLLRLAQKGSE